jgi:hypothetical protein
MGLNQYAYGTHASGLDAAQSTLAGLGQAVTGFIAGGSIDAIQRAINALGSAGSIFGIPPGGAAASASAVTGLSINPFMTVVFKTVAYKKHSLAWKLTPVNAAESVTVNKIINTLKYNELPGIAAGAALFTYPNVVQITISNVVADQQGQYFTFVFKPAVIQAVSVNYTPGGQPAFFNNTNAPSEVEIALSLSEIELWTQNDFTQGAAPVTQAGGAAFGANPAGGTNG